jgi:hypothetical protein
MVFTRTREVPKLPQIWHKFSANAFQGVGNARRLGVCAGEKIWSGEGNLVGVRGFEPPASTSRT